jgi:hypothetical protein
MSAGINKACADEFQNKHPRRAEVLKREKNEIRKNKDAYSDGEITKKQENKLNREDRQIRRQEQLEAKINGRHITKGEQRDLNLEENAVNRQRVDMEARDAAKKTPALPRPAGT